MAVVDDAVEQLEYKAIASLDALVGEKVETQDVDINADYFDAPAPPDDYIYLANFSLSRNPYSYLKNEEGVIISVKIELVWNFAEEEFQKKYGKDRMMFHSISTANKRGTKVSAASDMLVKAGVKVSSSTIDHLKLAKGITALASNGKLILPVETCWKAWSKVQKDTVRKGQVNFPKDGSGGYKYIFMEKGEELSATCKIVNIWPKNTSLKDLRAAWDKKHKDQVKSAAATKSTTGSNNAEATTTTTTDSDVSADEFEV